MQQQVTIKTHRPGLYEFTETVERFVQDVGIEVGVMTVFVRHTSCSLTIQENADPDVQADLQEFFERLVPEGMGWLRHTTEGPDDMPAHIKSALTQSSLSIPIVDAKLALGSWQGLYLFEHRRAPHHRQIVLHISQ